MVVIYRHGFQGLFWPHSRVHAGIRKLNVLPFPKAKCSAQQASARPRFPWQTSVRWIDRKQVAQKCLCYLCSARCAFNTTFKASSPKEMVAFSREVQVKKAWKDVWAKRMHIAKQIQQYPHQAPRGSFASHEYPARDLARALCIAT